MAGFRRTQKMPSILFATKNVVFALITKLLLSCVVMNIPGDSNFISIKVSSLCAHYSDRYLEHAKLQRQPKTTKLQMIMRKYIFFPDLNGWPGFRQTNLSWPMKIIEMRTHEARKLYDIESYIPSVM